MADAMYIEDFRLNNYLLAYLTIFNDRTNPMVEMTFNQYSMHAFYSTSDDINDLENEKNFINKGRRAIISVSLWYLALESYINCICKVCYLIKNKDFENIKSQNLNSRLTSLINILEYDEMEIKKTGIYNRINEFTQFRNEIFHDKYTGKNLPFKKTNFSTIPTLCNQVDIFQSAQIFIETVQLFRFCIPGLDLMPNISIGNSKILHFDKLDVLYNEYLKKYFEETLKKLNLQTHLNLDIDHYKTFDPSKIFNIGEIVPIFRREQEEKYVLDSNIQYTTIGKDLYNKLVVGYNLPDSHTSSYNFLIPKIDFSLLKFPMRN